MGQLVEVEFGGFAVRCQQEWDQLAELGLMLITIKKEDQRGELTKAELTYRRAVLENRARHLSKILEMY